MAVTLTDLSHRQRSSTRDLPPPQGIQPGSGDAKKKEPMFVLSSIFFGIMVLFFLNRIYTKSCIVRRFSWDDVSITFAVLGSVVLFVAAIWEGRHGKLFGNHAWDIHIAQDVGKDTIIPLWIWNCFPSIVYLFLKDTFFIMYLYIFGPMRWLRICAYTGAVVATAFYISVAVATFIFTTPQHGETWSEHLLSKEVLRSGILPVPTSIFGLVIDLIILLLPIVAVMQLQLPRGRRIGLICVFMTGSIACVFSMLGIYFRKMKGKSQDLGWYYRAVIIVTLLEVFVGIICACTPAAAKSCNHHLESLSTFKTFVVSQLSGIRSGAKQSQAFSESQIAEGRPGYCANIDIYQGPGYTENARGKSIQTFINKGKQHDVENDGIYLTYEMQNHVSKVRHPGHEAATSLEGVDMSYDSAFSETTTHGQSGQI